MILAIVSHTPTWVWGMLAALLALGLWQTRTRHVAPARLLALPLALLALGLSTLAPSVAAVPLSAPAWLLGFGLACAGGLRLRPRNGTRWIADRRQLLLPGSWLPLALIVAIFALRYALAVGLALNPAWRGAPAVLVPAAALLGTMSGFFLGRALGLLKLTRRHDTIGADAAALA